MGRNVAEILRARWADRSEARQAGCPGLGAGAFSSSPMTCDNEGTAVATLRRRRRGGNMISRLGHVGIHVRDLATSRRFYSELLGLTVTDENPEMELVFLSARPEVEHHELLLCGGRDAGLDERLVQQISFRCDTLEDVI